MDDKIIRLLPNMGRESEPADDVVLMLRTIADEIERNEYGEINAGAFVFKTEEGVYHTFGWGKQVKNIEQAHYLFSKAANMLL